MRLDIRNELGLGFGARVCMPIWQKCAVHVSSYGESECSNSQCHDYKKATKIADGLDIKLGLQAFHRRQEKVTPKFKTRSKNNNRPYT